MVSRTPLAFVASVACGIDGPERPRLWTAARSVQSPGGAGWRRPRVS